jgi:hypothetical protein
MSERMTDERLAEIEEAVRDNPEGADFMGIDRLVTALRAERQHVAELEGALLELISIVEIHSKATKSNFAWAELSGAKDALR